MPSCPPLRGACSYPNKSFPLSLGFPGSSRSLRTKRTQSFPPVPHMLVHSEKAGQPSGWTSMEAPERGSPSKDSHLVSGEQYTHSHPRPLTRRLKVTCVYKTWAAPQPGRGRRAQVHLWAPELFPHSLAGGLQGKAALPSLSFPSPLSLVPVLVMRPHWKSSVNKRL